MPVAQSFVPTYVGPSPPGPAKEPIVLMFDEFEVLRLVDLEGLTQEEAGERMGVSRGTVWRTLESARKKAVKALVEGRELVIASTPPAQKDQK